MKLVILITKGLIRDRNMRRATMFAVAIAAMLMVFLGSFFVGSKEVNPWVFLGYWMGCAWLTVLLLLLTLYDLIAIRAKLSAEQRKLRSEFFGTSPTDEKKK
ncbi:MAG: hypothetical protein WCH43_10130 [Verrucomicrobiota bacterium]